MNAHGALGPSHCEGSLKEAVLVLLSRPSLSHTSSRDECRQLIAVASATGSTANCDCHSVARFHRAPQVGAPRPRLFSTSQSYIKSTVTVNHRSLLYDNISKSLASPPAMDSLKQQKVFYRTYKPDPSPTANPAMGPYNHRGNYDTLNVFIHEQFQFLRSYYSRLG